MEHRYRRLLPLMLAAPVAAQAARWEFAESLTLSEAYTDNVYLSERDREGRWSTLVSPNFTLQGKGRRLSVQAAGAFQFVSGSAQTFYPRLNASAQSELVKQHLFLDAYATASQTTIDPLKPAGTPIHATRNLTTNYSIGVNPYYVTRLADLADLRVDYRYTQDFYVGSGLTDRSDHELSFLLGNGRFFDRLSWGLQGRYSKSFYDNDGEADTAFKSLSLRLGYPFLRHLSGYVSVGREWNQYQGSTTRNGGETWQVGLGWQPNSRISVDAGYGYRFFGHHPSLAIAYRHRHSHFRLSYHEDLETGYRGLPDQGLQTTDLGGHPLDPFTNGDLDAGGRIHVGDPRLQGANVNRTLEFSYRLTGRRTSLSSGGSYSFRTWEGTADELRQATLRIGLRRQLGRRLSADTDVHWNREEDESGFRSDTWEFRLGANRNLGTFTTLRFSYTYARRDSNQPDDSYGENRFALVLNTSMERLGRKAGWW